MVLLLFLLLLFLFLLVLLVLLAVLVVDGDGGDGSGDWRAATRVFFQHFSAFSVTTCVSQHWQAFDLKTPTQPANLKRTRSALHTRLAKGKHTRASAPAQHLH